MIPVRVSADFVPVAVGRELTLLPDHPLIRDGWSCPACDELLDAVRPIVLVPVGIAPQRRDRGAFTTAGAVPVHADCATPPPGP